MTKNMLNIYAVILMIALLPAMAFAKADNEFRHWLKIANGEEHHQQTQYQLVDPKGDAYLIRKLNLVPWKLLKALYDKGTGRSGDGIAPHELGLPTDLEFSMEIDTSVMDQEEIDARYDAMYESIYYDYGDEYQEDVEGEGNPEETSSENSRNLSEVRTGSLRGFALEDEREAVTRSREDSKDYQIGRKRSVVVDALVNQILIDIKATGIKPRLGIEHKWSPDAKKYNRFGFFERFGEFITGKTKTLPTPLFWRSKVFLSLACGWTAKYEVSGREQALEDKLLTYPDKSVRIHDVFRESYILNNGDMYLTMLTAENVLGKDPYDPDRENQPVQKKLMYIRNDSKPLGDNYGAWYHFYGIGLYGFVRKGLVAKAVGEIESFGSIFLEGFDWQEDHINRLGATFGNKLRKMIDKGEWKKSDISKDVSYMDFSEFAPTVKSPAGKIKVMGLEAQPMSDRVEISLQVFHKKGIFTQPESYHHSLKLSDLPGSYAEHYRIVEVREDFVRGRGSFTGREFTPEGIDFTIRLSKPWLPAKKVAGKLTLVLKRYTGQN